MNGTRFIGFLFLLAIPSFAAQPDLCAAPSSTADVKLSIALKDGQSVFQQGEIIPLNLVFTSTAKGRYWADVRSYDRSGRLSIEQYCVEPEVPDPLETYFRIGGFMGGGLGSDRQLSETSFIADGELNEWRSPGPGHYRLYVVSYRVWRPPDPGEKTSWGRIGATVRSNTVEFDVRPASPQWREEQLEAALQTLSSSATNDEKRHAARILRFLDSEASTRALAQQFWGLNQQQPVGWDLILGLFGSPYRQLAIEAMKAEISEPNHPITDDFLMMLARLEITGDPAWKPPTPTPSAPQEERAFWTSFQAHQRELTSQSIKLALAGLPAKTGSARALTLDGILNAGGDDPALVQSLRPALIASWPDLPVDVQQNLIQYRWQLIASPAMLPILRQIVDDPPAQARTMPGMTRDAALKHIYDLDPKLGRSLIYRDLQNAMAEPSIQLIELLPASEIGKAVPAAVDRIVHNHPRILDYALLDAYGDAGSLDVMRSAFEPDLGKSPCDPQSHVLRYFLRVAPDYGAKEVEGALHARQSTGCYRMLLQELADELPKAESVALSALDDADSEVAQDAALALGHWGTLDAEPALWTRTEKFHRDWTGHEDQLRSQPPFSDAGSHGVALEQNLVYAIAGGTSWICPPEKLQRLAELAWTGHQREEIMGWIKLWHQGPAQIMPTWFPEDHPTFSVLQYQALSQEQLQAKMAQFPRGMNVTFRFWQTGQIQPPVSMEKQEAVFQRLQVVAAEHGIMLARAISP
jgi:hypothetical protein